MYKLSWQTISHPHGGLHGIGRLAQLAGHAGGFDTTTGGLSTALSPHPGIQELARDQRGKGQGEMIGRTFILLFVSLVLLILLALLVQPVLVQLVWRKRSCLLYTSDAADE